MSSIHLRALALFALLSSAAACGPPSAIPVENVLADLSTFSRKRVTIRARFKSGARCRLGDDGEWKTYCKDCQYCRGPLVVDVAGAPSSTSTSTSTSTEARFEDWPMILGGTWDGQDIRCKGPLNKIECYPFEVGKTYVVRGVIESQRPPKLLVEKFWRVD